MSLKKPLKSNLDVAQHILHRGGIGILPTDTLYGIVGSALNARTVAKIYRLRRRNLKKPMIILISSLRDLALFNVRLDASARRILKKAWPGKVSVIMSLDPKSRKKLAYLHRDKGALAFRLPEPKWLRSFLAKTGPLVAPSANFEGELPALTISDAKKYFGSAPSVQFYLDVGRLASKPSTLITIEGGKIIILRKGAGNVKGVV